LASTSLEQQDESVPNKSGKPTQTPTLRWVFQRLDGISCALITGQEMMMVNIGDREAKIIQLMGADAMAIYKMIQCEFREKDTAVRWLLSCLSFAVRHLNDQDRRCGNIPTKPSWSEYKVRKTWCK
jgi:hypothetical protein